MHPDLTLQFVCLMIVTPLVAVFAAADLIGAHAPPDAWARVTGWLRRQIAHAWAAYAKPRTGEGDRSRLMQPPEPRARSPPVRTSWR